MQTVEITSEQKINSAIEDFFKRFDAQYDPSVTNHSPLLTDLEGDLIKEFHFTNDEALIFALASRVEMIRRLNNGMYSASAAGRRSEIVESVLAKALALKMTKGEKPC